MWRQTLPLRASSLGELTACEPVLSIGLKWAGGRSEVYFNDVVNVVVVDDLGDDGC
jgi:hypothetical protein